MPFKFNVGKCPKTLSELTIWTRYDTECEDNLNLKLTLIMNISKHRYTDGDCLILTCDILNDFAVIKLLHSYKNKNKRDFLRN